MVYNKPIQHILHPSKDLPAYTASRIQRYAVHLSQFDYTIEHRPSKQHMNADYFSRAFNENNINQIDTSIDVVQYLQNQRLSQLYANIALNRETLQKAASADPAYAKQLQELNEGIEINPEFTINDKLLFRNHRVVIPQSLQKTILDSLHDSHLGIVKMKNLARNYVWWKNIDNDIQQLVKSCQECAANQKNPAKAPLHTWEPATEPFERIHIDYGEKDGHQLLIIIDAYTKWLEVYATKTAPATSQTTIMFLRDYISRFGIPLNLVSDNAAIFRSAEFREFIDSYQIRLPEPAPGHPATNGLAERYVQFVKDKLTKMSTSTVPIQEKLTTLLMQYRITPTTMGKSPSELLFGKQIRNKFDMMLWTPKPRMQKSSSTPEVKRFHIGDRVQSRNYTNNIRWKFGTITKTFGKLHYLVRLDNGYVLKRHYNINFTASVFGCPHQQTQIQLTYQGVQPRAQKSLTQRRIPMEICLTRQYQKTTQHTRLHKSRPLSADRREYRVLYNVI